MNRIAQLILIFVVIIAAGLFLGWLFDVFSVDQLQQSATKLVGAVVVVGVAAALIGLVTSAGKK